MAIVKKTTVGFVIQEYDTETGKFVSQEFVAGDQVDWEDNFGDALCNPPNEYLSFDMVQPKNPTQEAPTVAQEVEERRIK